MFYRDNAEDCVFLAERAEDGEVKRALRRMEEAWRTLAQEQVQLDNKRWSTKKAVLARRLIYYHPTRTRSRAGFNDVLSKLSIAAQIEIEFEYELL
jgi:hypothetical protein